MLRDHITSEVELWGRRDEVDARCYASVSQGIRDDKYGTGPMVVDSEPDADGRSGEDRVGAVDDDMAVLARSGQLGRRRGPALRRTRAHVVRSERRYLANETAYTRPS